MRYLERIHPLPQRVTQTLAEYQRVINRHVANMAPGSPRTKRITNIWDNRRQSKTLQAVEVALKAMASGIARCMYCDEGHGHQIEHFRPKADYYKEAFTWENMLWVCGECNDGKNTKFDDQILNPTLDNPLEYLQLTSEGRFKAPPASRGALTLECLTRLSVQDLIDGRKIAFEHIKLMLTKLFPVAGDESRAMIRRYVINSPFGSVFAAILHTSREQDAIEVLGPELISVLDQNPEIYDWLETADKERRARALVAIEEIAQHIGVDVSEDDEVAENEI